MVTEERREQDEKMEIEGWAVGGVRRDRGMSYSPVEQRAKFLPSPTHRCEQFSFIFLLFKTKLFPFLIYFVPVDKVH